MGVRYPWDKCYKKKRPKRKNNRYGILPGYGSVSDEQEVYEEGAQRQ